MSAQILSIDWDIKYILKNILKEYDMTKEHQANLVEVIQLVLQGEKEQSLAKWEQACKKLIELNEANAKNPADSAKYSALENNSNYRRVVSYILGLCYQYGWKAQKNAQDGKSAFDIFSNLTKFLPFIPAHYSQGLCWEMGVGCEKDLEKAYEAYSVATAGSPRDLISGVFQYKFGLCQEHPKAYTKNSLIRSVESPIHFYKRAGGQNPDPLGFLVKPYPRALRVLGIEYLTNTRPGKLYDHSDYLKGIKLLIAANKAFERCERETCSVSETKEKQELESVIDTQENQEKMSMGSSNTSAQVQKDEILIWDADPNVPKTSDQVLIMDLDPKDREITNKFRFKMTDHSLNIYGVCESCNRG